jgi:hypothetical protein
MKMKHNKKRNSAFIFEVLIRELAKTIMEKNDNKKKIIMKLIREHFKGNTILAKDMDIYKSILDTKNVERHTAERLIFESRMQKKTINHRELFKEQTEIINKINKFISPEAFSNFIPNYRDLATVFQIFNPKVKTKQRVLLENHMINVMVTEEEREKEFLKPIDNLTYKTFVQKFNEKYSSKLIKEQKELLSKYISSFADHGIELKIFLNEEIPRLKNIVKNSLNLKEIKNDQDMMEKTKKVIKILETTSKRVLDNKFVHDILKIQGLVKELA